MLSSGKIAHKINYVHFICQHLENNLKQHLDNINTFNITAFYWVIIDVEWYKQFGLTLKVPLYICDTENRC